MSGPFAEQLPRSAGGGAIRVWLKSSAYTSRLLLGAGGANPWASAAQYLAYFSQAHSLLKPDVAVLEVGELFDAWIAANGGLAGRLGNRRRPATALRKLLEPEEPKAVLAEVVQAVLSHLRGQVPLVLSMPSPRRWLHHANELVDGPGAGSDEELDPDTVEDGAMYLADLVRSVSTFPIAGLLLEERAEDAALSGEHVARYRSIINVVRHYRWSLALRVPAQALLAAEALADFDAVIGLPGRYDGALPWGRDVSAEFGADAPMPPLSAGQFYFAQLEPGQRPESVLAILARLRVSA